MRANVEAGLCRQLLMMADDELILGHRNSEWAGHAPILEEDIAFANIAQDEIGHASIWYKLLSDITGDELDRLVFFRDAGDFLNCQLVELPRGDWARTILRQYLFDAFELVRGDLLVKSSYQPMAEAAAKIKPEEMYHYRHTSSWVKWLGLGTSESSRRMQEALEFLWPYAQQLFLREDSDDELAAANILPSKLNLMEKWRPLVEGQLNEAGLKIPNDLTPNTSFRSQHTEHLNSLLSEMQEVARLDPEAQW